LSLANTGAVAGGFQQITGLSGGRTVAADSQGRLVYVTNSTLTRGTISPTTGAVTAVNISALEINNARNVTVRVIGGIEYAYVVEGGANQIIRYNLSAASFPTPKVQVLTGLNGPRGLAFESDTVLYVSDSGNNRIMKLDTVTNTLSRFARTGTASSTGNGGDPLLATFNVPAALAFSNDRKTLYVSEENASTTRDVAAIRFITEQIN
jgi:serine/threonine-protein kinase